MICNHPYLQVNDAGICECGASLTITIPAPVSEIEQRIDNLTEKWSWVIGGIVDNDSRYVRAIIHDFLGVPIPSRTFHTRDGMRAWESDYRHALLVKEAMEDPI